MIAPANIQNAFPCTAMQRGMLYHCLEAQQSDVYVTYITLDIAGALDLECFQESWQRVSRQHESLRSSFQWEGLEEPLQVVHCTVDFPWTLGVVPAEQQHDTQKYLKDIVEQERLKIPDPGSVPLMRFRLLQHSHESWTLVWVVHHLLADGWSTPIILQDVMSHYSSLQRGHSAFMQPSFQLAEHSEWLQHQNTPEAKSYWQDALKGASITPLHLPRPVNSCTRTRIAGKITEFRHVFSKESTRSLVDYGKKSRLTVGSLAHAAWALLLREYCDSQQVLFGTSVSGRQSGIPGVENAVGLFLNTLPLYIDMPDDAVLSEWLIQVQQRIQSNLEFQCISLADIQASVPDLNGEQPIESIVVIESHASDLELTSDNNSIALSNIDYLTHSHFPLALLVYPGTQLRLTLVYDASVFQSDHVQVLFDRLLWLLVFMLENPDATLLEVSSALSGVTYIHEQHAGVRSPPGAYVTMHEWVESVGAQYSQRQAVVCGSETATYQQLLERCNQLANLLIAEGYGNYPLIGVCLTRSIDQIAALLAVLKLGAAYVPFDADYPIDRLRHMAEDSGISVMITSRLLVHRIAQVLQDHVLVESADVISAKAPESRPVKKDDLAYLLYTSGSTGAAKGVRITHENLVYSTETRIEFYQLDAPRFLLLSSVTFDSSVAGIYGTLCSGGTLVLPEPGQERDVDRLSSLVATHGVTHTLCLPALYDILLDCSTPQNLLSLQVVTVAGESCTLSVVKRHQAVLGSARLFNEYGPTEACVWATVYETDMRQELPVPIGKPVGDSLVLVLNSQLRPCLPGVEGELYIGGRGVAAGYHANSEATREKFVTIDYLSDQWPVLYCTGDLAYEDTNGVLFFRGRVDRQLKIRGHRVEPAEIESIIREHPSVAEVIVVARTIPVPAASDVATSDMLADRLLQMPDDVREELLRDVEQLGPEQLQQQLAEIYS